jgi:hypothetical protein
VAGIERVIFPAAGISTHRPFADGSREYASASPARDILRCRKDFRPGCAVDGAADSDGVWPDEADTRLAASMGLVAWLIR